MKMARTLCLCLAFLPAYSGRSAAQTDPLIEGMVAAVSQIRLTNSVQTLQDLQTRHTYSQGNTDAGNWLFAYFASLGLEVERHSFTYTGHTEENIIGRIAGTTSPNEIVIISGHFDSTSENPNVLAPGADDDASAIAGVLEAAFLLSAYRFDRTIEFICFNAEEQGRKGSIALASDYQAWGRNIVAVINSDMIGYWPTGWQRDLDVAYEPVSGWLADHVIATCQSYVGIPVAKHLSGGCQDDHYSFTTLGIPGVTNMDCWNAHNGGGETTPHYHRTTDTIGTLNLGCMTQVVQVNVASVAALARPQDPVGMEPGSDQGDHLASRVRLAVRPNPVLQQGVISYHAPFDGTVYLRILDPAGRVIRRYTDEHRAGRWGTYVWEGTDDADRPIAPGVYFLELTAGPARATEKVLLIR